MNDEPGSVTIGEWAAQIAEGRRRVDVRLHEIAQCLTPDLRSRLLDLLAAAPDVDARARVESLIEQSSLGTEEAKTAREAVPREIGIAIAKAAEYLGRARQAEEALELSEGEREDLDTARGTLLGENVELEASLERVHALLAKWDQLSRGESETTKAIRAAIAGDQ